MELYIAFALIMFLAALVASMAGFGAALVAMPLLISLLGLQKAAAAFSLAIITQELLLILLFRKSFDLKAVWRLALPSILMIPVGVALATILPNKITLTVLGIVILCYALYSLFGFTLPRLKNANWAFPFGMVGGLFGGAYNIAGPPLIIYGDMSDWDRNMFRANLMGVFMCNNLTAIASRYVGGQISAESLWLALAAAPAIVIGVLLGKATDRFINVVTFRKLVLLLLLVISVRLLYTTLA